MNYIKEIGEAVIPVVRLEMNAKPHRIESLDHYVCAWHNKISICKVGYKILVRDCLRAIIRAAGERGTLCELRPFCSGKLITSRPRRVSGRVINSPGTYTRLAVNKGPNPQAALEYVLYA